MATRAYFNAYHSYLETMELLNDAERGRLFTACLTYSMTGEVQELRGNEKFVFPGMKSQIDRDTEAYEAKCEKNRQNGAKGGSERKRTVANGGERKRTVANGGQGKGKEKGEGELNTPPNPPEGDGWFETFWKHYPRKESKSDTKKKWDKLNVDAELFAKIMNGLERQKCSLQWTKDNGQYIPYPSTWINQKRWEDEGEEQPEPTLYRKLERMW